MSQQRNANISDKPVSLLVLEGYTEQVFYSVVRDKFLKGIRIELRNIKGQGNVNKDILSEIFKYTYNNPDDLVRAYCCVDTEKGKCTATPLYLDFIREKAKERKMSQVLSIHAILAEPEIESWFFYDIKGIYGCLSAPKSRRNPKIFNPAKKFGYKDLQRLFEKHGKIYTKGKRAGNFINHLDVGKIVSNCKELREGIKLIQSQANNLTNYLFPAKIT